MADATTAAPTDQVEVHEAQLPEVQGKPAAAARPIEFLLDTTMPVQVQLGTAQVSVRDLLALGPGSVLKLDQRVGEPLALFIRGTRFASGQLVVVENQLGIRITEIMPAPSQGA